MVIAIPGISPKRNALPGIAPMAAATNALAGQQPEEPWYQGIFDVLDYINRPLYATAGSITALQEGRPENVLSRAWEGFTGEKKYTSRDILHNLGVRDEKALFWGGLAGDVLLSFPIYPSIGQLTKLGKMGRIIGKVGKTAGLSADDIARNTERLTKLGKKLLAGERVPGLVGLGREAAIKLAQGEKILPLAATLAGQADKSQRALISLFGGALPIKTGLESPVFKALTGTGKALQASFVGKNIVPLFKRTTGHDGLDDVLYASGGSVDAKMRVATLLDEVNDDVVRVGKDVLNQLRKTPDDLEHFMNSVVSLAETPKSPIKLPSHLKYLEETRDELVGALQRFARTSAELERKAGLPLAIRQNYVAHLLTPEARRIIRDSPELLQTTIRTRGYHGSLEQRLLTSIGDIPQINQLAKQGHFGDALAAIPKFLDNNPIKIAQSRAYRTIAAVHNNQMIEGVKQISKVLSPEEFLKYGRIPPGTRILALDPKRGLMQTPEFISTLADEVLALKGLEIPAGATLKEMMEHPKLQKQLTALMQIMSGQEAEGTKAITEAFLSLVKQRKGQFLLVGDDLADAVMAQRKLIYQPQAMEQATNAALGAYDKVHGFLRRWTLGIFPSWMARNALGNYSAQWYMGMGPTSMLRYSGKAGKLQSLVFRAGANWRKLDEVIEVGGEALKASDFFDEMLRYGVPGRGFSKAVWEEGMSKLGKADLSRLGFRVNRAIENNARIGAYMFLRDRGHAAKEAADTVKHFLFDYDSLSKFEKQGLKRTFFFYSWLRKNTALQMETFLTNPFKIVPLSALQINAMKATGLDKESLPLWAQEAVPLPVGKKGEKATFGTLASWIPAGDLIELINDPKKKLLGSLTPLITTGPELMFNRSIFQEREIERYPGEAKELFGMQVPAKVQYAATKFRPVGAVERFRGAREITALGFPEEMTRFLVGIRLYTRDLNQEQKIREMKRRGDIGKLKRYRKYYLRRGPMWASKVANIEAMMKEYGIEPK